MTESSCTARDCARRTHRVPTVEPSPGARRVRARMRASPTKRATPARRIAQSPRSVIASTQTVIATISPRSSPGAISTPRCHGPGTSASNGGDGVPVAFDLVLVVDDVALRLQLAALSRSIEKRSRRPTSAFFTVARSPSPRSIAILSRTLSLRSGSSPPRCPPAPRSRTSAAREGPCRRRESPIAVVVLDPVVVADRKQLLAHLVAGAGGLAGPLPGLAAVPWPYCRAIATRRRSSGVIRWSRSSAASSMSIWTQSTAPGEPRLPSGRSRR